MKLPEELVVDQWKLTVCGQSGGFGAYVAEPIGDTQLRLDYVNVDDYGSQRESVQCVFYLGAEKYKLRLDCKLSEITLESIYDSLIKDVKSRDINLDAARQFSRLSRELLKVVMNDLHKKQ